MSYLSNQIEALEEQYDDAVAALEETRREVSNLEDRVAELEFEVEDMEKYIEWFEATYPEAKVAYEVAQRVST